MKLFLTNPCRCLLAVMTIAPAVALSCGPTSTYEFTPCEASEPDARGVATCGPYTHRARAVDCAEGDPNAATNFETPCTTDSDCSNEASDLQYCFCGPNGGVCKFTLCRTDAECAAPFVCAALARTNLPSEQEEPAYGCQHPEDECMLRSDCPQGYCLSSGPRFCADICDDCE